MLFVPSQCEHPTLRDGSGGSHTLWHSVTEGAEYLDVKYLGLASWWLAVSSMWCAARMHMITASDEIGYIVGVVGVANPTLVSTFQRHATAAKFERTEMLRAPPDV